MQKNNRYRLKPHEIAALKRMRETETRNVLVIGDLHCPWDLDEYLPWVVEQYNIWNCTQTIFIGDLLDSAGYSYHEQNPDLPSAGDELNYAIKRVQRWYNEFDEVGTKVIIGNHDRMASRKMMTGGIPSAWLKSYNEVLGTPNWEFVERYVQDGVQYVHGEGGTARTKCRADMMNTVQGHLHTQCYTEHYVGRNFRVYGTQVGTGINFTNLSFNYAKAGKKPAIGCAVILNNGTLPINLLMPL